MIKKVMAAMSGGVDSSVCAALLKMQGFEVTGATMKLFSPPADKLTEKSCCTADDAFDAKSVCFSMGIPHYVFNFTDEFDRSVIKNFTSSYLNGRTPNPCIECNRILKFDKLLRRAKEIGIEKIATGHYAIIEEKDSRFLLKKAKDTKKDQTYVLYTLTQKQLSCTLFPLGGLTKPEVREIAAKNGFVNAHKHESQDICFVPDGDYAAFIREYENLTPKAGDFINTAGEILGRHSGIINYTIGQRKGLGITFGKPMYVTRIDAQNNTVTLGESQALFSQKVILTDINLITCEELKTPRSFKAKTRYNQTEQPCKVSQTAENEIEVLFDEPQRAVTPGQACVIYDGDYVVGGGRIMGQRNN
ncbi:MAG: tRNA 2-thiouridine(34) synthase MnmA [Ruminococcus sp.]|jgi:tRNA-specific 2-thiouridylase|nr:tRNA 2-thiouridine(34) synthase MnmA [Ruminococcus sp.]